MSSNSKRVSNYIDELLKNDTLENLISRISFKKGEKAIRIPSGNSQEEIYGRLSLLNISDSEKSLLTDMISIDSTESYISNIENYIGTVKVPVGLIGPLRVNGLFSQGDYLLPLATTEAALIASYNRGVNLITKAGGCSAMLLNEGVSRAPGFIFKNLREAGVFIVWIEEHLEQFKKEAAKTTSHGLLIDMKVTLEGNHVYLNFDYQTGDASGQNMVTFATERICEYILQHSPVKPMDWFIEANLSGDKKASYQSFQSVRGRKVTAEVIIPGELVISVLHTSAEKLGDYWRLSAIGGSLSGTIGMQGHYANGLAALYLACGQDIACVSESAIGVTRFEETKQGDLYASVTLPNLMVATVGGGTGLPTQYACLKITDMAGKNKARGFAEVAAALCLAGELSIMGALCAGDFSKAHKCLARNRK